MLTSFGRLLKFAVRDFARNIWLSVTTILILTLTLVSVQVLLTVNVAGRIALEELESRVDLRVQFLPAVSETEVDAVRVRIQQRPEVRAVEHRARAQVLEEFQTAHRGNTEILEALTELGENPFGPELRIQVHRPEDLAAVAREFEDPTISASVTETGAGDRLALVERLSALTAKLRTAGIALSGLSFIVTLLIIINAMRIATYARRDEVGIMKLVGATNWFVRTPFLIMGVLSSAVATGIAQAITIPSLRALEPTFIEFLGTRGVDIATFFRDHLWTIIGAEFLGLAFLTVLISAIAIRRYLRV
ncbi:MAG: permease-like cell division protein FtsX [bacterium]|nr:permease-like cell division protein FtsX [bacterium]